MKKQFIQTDGAPKAIGAYSQAVKVGDMVFLSGQIPLVPETMELAGQQIEQQVHQVFANMRAVAQAANGSLSDIVKLTIFLTDLSHFPTVNTLMAEYFAQPYPARSTIEVSALPKGSLVEIEAIMVVANNG